MFENKKNSPLKIIEVKFFEQSIVSQFALAHIHNILCVHI